jgi:hypothetical protein
MTKNNPSWPSEPEELDEKVEIFAHSFALSDPPFAGQRFFSIFGEKQATVV